MILGVHYDPGRALFGLLNAAAFVTHQSLDMQTHRSKGVVDHRH